MDLKKRFGFTLIEIIVVVAVIGVLASAIIAILDPFTQIQKAQDARTKSDLAQIQRALEAYYQDNGFYPADCGVGNYQIMSGGTCIAWGQPWSPYMDTLPKDGNPAHTYVYYQVPGGQAYYLYANLGRGTKDPQACTSGVCTSPGGSGINMSTACGAPCNFGLSSPNVSP